MSRSRACLIIFFAMLSASAPASAQDAIDRKVETMIETAKEAYGPPAPRSSSCLQDSNGEIVVCAPDHGERWRVPPTSETDPGSPQALRDSIPRPPNVSGLPDCRSGCTKFGSAPPPVYMIDLSGIPEAPAESDADKVAKGEMSDR